MTFDLKRSLEGKRALRRKLANLPVAKKLAMLDALRDRQHTLREAARHSQSAALSESHAGGEAKMTGSEPITLDQPR
jgi:hypothetical protein